MWTNFHVFEVERIQSLNKQGKILLTSFEFFKCLQSLWNMFAIIKHWKAFGLQGWLILFWRLLKECLMINWQISGYAASVFNQKLIWQTTKSKYDFCWGLQSYKMVKFLNRIKNLGNWYKCLKRILDHSMAENIWIKFKAQVKTT